MRTVCIVFQMCVLFLCCSFVKAEDFSGKSVYIEVYFDIYIMRVWQSDTKTGLELIGDFPVTLTRRNFKLPQIALITNVEFNPSWYPPPGVKKWYFKKYGRNLRDKYGPGDTRNAMGSFKWTLNFLNREGFFMGDSLTRVHQEKNVHKIQTRDSAGCVRLLEKDGLYLTELLSGKKDRVMVYTTSDNVLEMYSGINKVLVDSYN